MKKKLIVAGVAAATSIGVATALKKKKEDGDIIFKRLYPEKVADTAMGKAIDRLKDKLEDFQINVLCATDVPLDYLKKTTENLKGEFARAEENFRRAMERSQSKLSSELLKTQMELNRKIKESKDAAEAKSYENQKAKDAAFAKAAAEDAAALSSFALHLMEEAMNAAIAAEALTKEYEATYDEALEKPADKIIDNLNDDSEGKA